jgi:DNA-binding NarL/FixJ family response regulator
MLNCHFRYRAYPMFWHPLRDEDLISCLDIDPRRVGAELIGKDRAIEAWKALMRSCAFRSSVIKSEQPIQGNRIVGFGAAVFVSSAFVDEEVCDPRPGLNTRIITSVDSGDSVVLNKVALRRANTKGGLDLVVLYPQWRKDVLSAGQVSEVQTLLASSFLERHRGFRLNRLVTEVLDLSERRSYVEPTGVWRVTSEFSEFYSRQQNVTWNRERCLAVITRQEAFRVPGHITSILFQYNEPSLGLSDVDQRLLEAGLTGLTDEELAHALNTGLATVKKRWRSIFERVAARSDLFPDLSGGLDDVGRGRQKRHYILSYVREHPEELRPFGARNRADRPRPA